MDLRRIRTSFEQSFVGRCVTSFVELRGLDRAMILASQSFTALIPLLILISAVLPIGSGNSAADAIIRRFELTGDAARSVEVAFAQSEPSSVGVVSLFLLVFSGVSLTRRLQRLYLQAYGLPPRPGLRSSLNAASGLAALIVEIALLYLVGTLVRALPFELTFATVMSAVAGLVLWTSVPYLLLDRRIPWRRLLPGGVLAAVGVSLYGLATTVYMTRLLTAYSQRYGVFGVTVALVGWLLCVCSIVVATTIVAAELDRAPEAWARRLRARLGADAHRPDPIPSTDATRRGDEGE
jgi:membrane protein